MLARRARAIKASPPVRVAMALMLFAAPLMTAGMDAHAQYTSKPLGAPGADLGPSARPSGNLPASGLLPGTPARPPGEFGASTYSPVNPLPNPVPPARPAPGIIRLEPPRDYQRGHGEMTEAQIRRFTEYCKTHRKLTRCKAFLDPNELKQKRDPDDE